MPTESSIEHAPGNLPASVDLRMLDLQALRIFKAVADEANVTRAAAQLHYVQSNVTARLRQLEADLGVALFHRTGGRLVITPAGLKLRGYAERLLRLAQEARRCVISDGVPRGPLLIGSMETTAAARLPEILAAFHRQYPEVDLALETGPTDALVRRVLDYRLDAALVGGDIEHPFLDGAAVFDEQLALVTARTVRRVRSAHDVADAMLLVFRTGCSYRRRLEAWFAAAGVAPRKTLEFGTFEGIIACAAVGMGVALMPQAMLRKRGMRAAIAVHPIDPKFAQIRTRLIWRRDSAELPARDAFLAALLAAHAGSTPAARQPPAGPAVAPRPDAGRA